MSISAAELRQIMESLYTGIQISPNTGNEAYRESVNHLREVATTFFTPAADGKYPAFGEEELTQVMDFICMNCDHHQNNMMYNFDDAGKLSKVVGIDNDLSFGTRPISANRGIMYGTAFAGLNVMTEKMADRISKLNVNTIVDQLSATNREQTRESIAQLIRKNGVLDEMLSAKDALKTLSDMAVKDPNALMKKYGNTLNNHIHTGGNQPAPKAKPEVKPQVLG